MQGQAAGSEATFCFVALGDPLTIPLPPPWHPHVPTPPKSLHVPFLDTRAALPPDPPNPCAFAVPQLHGFRGPAQAFP